MGYIINQDCYSSVLLRSNSKDEKIYHISYDIGSETKQKYHFRGADPFPINVLQTIDVHSVVHCRIEIFIFIVNPFVSSEK